MPKVPILMPQLGESIAEATVIRLYAQAGDTVRADQEVIEVETNKAVMGVTTLCAGVISDLRAKEGVSYPVGTVLGFLDVTEEEVARTGVDICDPAESRKSISSEGAGGEADANLHFVSNEDEYEENIPIIPSVMGLPVPTGTMGAHYISPRMRALMDDLGLREADISAVAGTGAGGRVTVEDLEKFLEYLETSWPSTYASPMRLAVADAMRRSWTRPLATVGLPVRLDHVLAHRRSQDPKPGLTLYFLRALALALAENPASAGYLIGEKIIHPRAFDIGVAVQIEDGVLVPVMRNVDGKRLADLNAEYADLVERARRRRLTEKETSGGIATVTNFGTFGLTTGAPIPLPNETLILGVGAGVKRPLWCAEVNTFIPATESDIVLTFDHRVVDGGGAGHLLNRISELLQKPGEL